MEVADCALWPKIPGRITTFCHHRSSVLASQASLSPSWEPVRVVKAETVPLVAGRGHRGKLSSTQESLQILLLAAHGRGKSEEARGISGFYPDP